MSLRITYFNYLLLLLPDYYLSLVLIIIYLQIVYSPPLIYAYARPIESLLLCFLGVQLGQTLAEQHSFQKRHAHTPLSRYSSFEQSTSVEHVWTGLETRVKRFVNCRFRLATPHKLVSSSVTAVYMTTRKTDEEPPPTNQPPPPSTPDPPDSIAQNIVSFSFFNVHLLLIMNLIITI